MKKRSFLFLLAIICVGAMSIIVVSPLNISLIGLAIVVGLGLCLSLLLASILTDATRDQKTKDERAKQKTTPPRYTGSGSTGL